MTASNKADSDRLRWEIRPRSLMLLVAIAALAVYIGARWVHQQEVARNAEAALAQAAAESQQAALRAWHAQDTAGQTASPAPAGPSR